MTFFLILLALFFVLLIVFGRIATREYEEIRKRYNAPSSE